MTELRRALRRLRRRPARGLATAATLALGIGTATAAWAAIQGVLLRDLPVERQDDLIVAWRLNPERGSLRIPFRAASFDAISRGAASLAEVAGFSAWGALPAALDDPDGPSSLRRVTIAGDFFGVLGARPAAGRLLDGSDDRPGAPFAAVIAHDVWTSRFDASPDVIGSTLALDGERVIVVGVAPAGLDFPADTEIWVPIRGDYGAWPDTGPANDVELHVVARTAPGADLATVTADLAATLATPGPDADGSASLQPVVVGLVDHVLGPARPVVRAAFGAALVLLAAAAANAVLLLLGGGRTTAVEVALRRALGAGRGRIVARLASDAVLAGGLGTLGGVVLAWSALRVLLPLAPPELPRVETVSFGSSALLFGLAAGAVATVVVGTLAGSVFAGGSVRTRLAAETASGRNRGLGRGVVGLQVALAVVSAVGAGLLGRTVVALNRIDPGFAAGDMTVVSLRVPYGWMNVPPTYFDALEAVARDLEARPGVIAVRPSLGPPLQQHLEVVLTAEGQAAEDVRENPYVAVDAVLPGHLRAMGIELLAGRDLRAADDRPDAAPVVVVDEVLARTLWPGEDPLGKRINGFGHFDTWFTVVGMAAGTRYRELLEPHPRAYYPLRRLGNGAPSVLLVRAAGLAPDAVGRLVRDAVERADPAVRIVDAQPMTELLRRPTAASRFAARVLGFFAFATLLLAGLGVYGAFTVAVQERVREMGVRKALGAEPLGIVALVLGSTLRVAVVGAALGIAAAAGATRIVSSLLYGIEPDDPATLALAGVVTVGLALLAGLAPALRASSTDPASSLRHE